MSKVNINGVERELVLGSDVHQYIKIEYPKKMFGNFDVILKDNRILLKNITIGFEKEKREEILLVDITNKKEKIVVCPISMLGELISSH